MEKIVSKSKVYMHFTKESTREFYIQELGYEDFHHTEPLKVTRIQSFYTMHLVLDGSGLLFLDGKKYHVKTGDFFFVPPNTNLCYYPNEEDPWRYMWFTMNGTYTEHYIRLCNLALEAPVISCIDFLGIQMKAMSLLHKLDKKGLIGYYETLSLFYNIVEIQSSADQTLPPNIEELSVTYMDIHYHEPTFSVEHMCRALHVSHSYLCKKFKQKWGKQPRKYLIEVRMREAKELLVKTDLNIKEIAFSVGFCDEIHFMKTFKTQEGITCKEYKKINRIKG